jgi:Uma2 family endonuclease
VALTSVRDRVIVVTCGEECSTMESMPVMPREGDWTVDDLLALPDDGLQYELADGVLLVTPAPRPRHQRALGNLHVLLRAAVPEQLEVFMAPLDFQPTRRRSLQPDLLVVRREDVGELNITAPLLLAVEVLSPSTRAKDLLLKRGLYEDSGVQSYWIVDPEVPSIVVLELRAGVYEQVALATGAETVSVALPFPVTVVPAALVR